MDRDHDGRVSYNEFVDYVFANAPGEKVLLTNDEVTQAKDARAKAGSFDRKATEDLLQQAQSAHWYHGQMKEKALSLLEEKADPNVTDRSGATVLMIMASKVDVSFAKLMIDAGADSAVHDKDLNCPVFVAASHRDTDMLRLFLMPESTPVEPDETQEGESASESRISMREKVSEELVTQMSSHTPADIRGLVQKKADINFKNSSGWTPLTMATFLDRKDAVETIVRAGGLVHGSKLRMELKNRQGRSAMHLAARKNLPEIMEVLLKNSAQPDIRDPDGWTPLHHACCNGHSEAVQVLIKHDAMVDIKSFGGLTPYQVTRLRSNPGQLSQEALALVKPPDGVDFAKCLLPILKAEETSPFQKLEEVLALPAVYNNCELLRLHEQFFDPTHGPNKVKLQKVWSLLTKPLLQCLRTGRMDMSPDPPQDLGDEDKEIHLIEFNRRTKLVKMFAEMWMQATKGPMPSVSWDHDNRGPYKEELRSFLDDEINSFKEELDAVYAKVRDAEGGEDLISIAAKEVLQASMLSQLGAHPAPVWLQSLNVAEAFEELRLVGAITGKEDDLATLAFAEMVTYEPDFLSGKPFWKNIYRKWLACYAKMADKEFHIKLQAIIARFNKEHKDDDISATYSKGPLKTYQRMRADEKDRGLIASAETYEGRTVSASCLDMIRGTISVNSPKEMLALLDCFRKLDLSVDKMNLVQVKNFFNESEEGMDGFRYLELNVLFKCGVRQGACDREGKSLMLSLVGEVQIVFNDYVAIKKRRSLQYKLWRGFFDWQIDDDQDQDEDSQESSSSRLKKRGHAGLYEDDS
eukprot:TRINITY_DN66369_c0_g1_i1.p1 TRINITY_DN66369_c0_g1~~TRINITY_DN66369_c0_g1_i1.p1  ORF type:complete len:902 (-),score=229.28 TRINITY_DN66369_c0_g1_i1:89-2506(-)